MRNSWRAYEYKVLTIGSPQFFHCKWKRENVLLICVIHMPDHARVEDNDVVSVIYHGKCTGFIGVVSSDVIHVFAKSVVEGHVLIIRITKCWATQTKRCQTLLD